MEEKTFRLATILLSLATLLLTAIITVGGYIKFQTVDSSLAKLDATIKESEGRIKVVEAQKAEASILGVKPVLILGDRSYGYLQTVSFNLDLKNLGASPVNLGLLTVEVFEAEAPQEIANELAIASRREDEYSNPVPATPAVVDPAAAPSPGNEARSSAVSPLGQEETASQPANTSALAEQRRAIPTATTLYSLSFPDSQWHELKPFRKKMKITYALLSGQDRQLEFEYLLTNSLTPKWFKIVATLEPPPESDGPQRWNRQRIEKVFKGGPWPGRYAAFQYCSTTRGDASLEPLPAPAAIPIPQSAIEEIKD